MSKVLTLLMLLTLLMIGCNNPSNSLETPTVEDSATDALFRMGDWATVQEFIKANAGKVVVVDIWSTYCAPCMKEFPRLIGLQEKYSDEIACASFNINYAGLPDQTPETDIEFIEPFLKRHGHSVDHIISTVNDEEIYAELEIYAIPAVLIYDKDGKLTNKVLEENAYESTIYPRVAEMLGQSQVTGESDAQQN